MSLNEIIKTTQSLELKKFERLWEVKLREQINVNFY